MNSSVKDLAHILIMVFVSTVWGVAVVYATLYYGVLYCGPNSVLTEIKESSLCQTVLNRPPWILISGLAGSLGIIWNWLWLSIKRSRELESRLRSDEKAAHESYLSSIKTAIELIQSNQKFSIEAGLRILFRLARTSIREHRYIDLLMVLETINDIRLRNSSELKHIVDASFMHLNLRGVILEGIDLKQSNLSGKDLSRASMKDSNLAKTNLNNSVLIRCKLHSTIFKEASMMRVNLSEANLTDANLTSAKLSNAILKNANLSNAKLFNADLTQADLSGADLSNTDLRGADFIGCKSPWS